MTDCAHSVAVMPDRKADLLQANPMCRGDTNCIWCGMVIYFGTHLELIDLLASTVAYFIDPPMGFSEELRNFGN